MKKITLTIASKDYTITLDEVFCETFEQDLRRFFEDELSMGVKDLLSAFVQKCYETHLQERKMENLSNSINERLKFNIEQK